nr:hypothetical protein [Tanacetum cinerariifolium]
MLLMQAQDNGVALDEEQLLFLADPVHDEVRPSYDSNILSEVQDHDQYQDVVCAHHEEYVMHVNVQLNHVVDSHADYTSDSNMIPYDQYVKDNEVTSVHSNVSSILNDAFMMIYNDMCEPLAQSVSNPSRITVVKNSLTAELATYKEQVELYERRAKFELTDQEQKINEQLRLVISDHNFKEETLKRDLHSIKLQLASTINHNKSMVEEVTFLKRPKPHYNELNKVAIGYKNPLCLTRAKQVQPTLYNGHEIIKDNHTPAIVHNIEDTLEIAEITRKKMNDKINDPKCVTRKADDYDSFDSDVDKVPMAQTMFMANLSSADPVTDEVGPSYDSDILSEVQDHDHYQDAVCPHHEEYAMHENVQLNHVVDSHADYTSNSDMILFDQYVKDNVVSVVHSNVSSVPNDAYMMIYNNMFEPHAQSISNTSRNTVVENSLTAEPVTYKEQVELYERLAKFELTKREQKINEKLRLVISDRNFKEETLKRELHSINCN